MKVRSSLGRKMLGAALACASFAARAQSAPPSVARSLGIFVYPSSGQTSQQQVLDEGECFAWAQQQTGANPLAPAARPEPSAAAKPSDSSDAAAKGAVTGAAGGAVAGTAIGAVAGDTGKGAAIGATAGLLKGARQARMAAKQQQQSPVTNPPAPAHPQREMFNRALGACLEGRGYTVK